MRIRKYIPTVIVIAAALAAPPIFAEVGIDAADAAFRAGNHDEALELYNQVLEGDPDNVRALVQSGKLLSWRKRYEEAIERYDRVLEIDPTEETARLERAKVLSWSRQFSRAAEAFRTIVEDEPANIDARLGLARVLSWGGHQLSARTEYERILDDDPSNIAATIGVAQTYAWSGEAAEARRWYDRVLASDPEQKSAILGTAYLDLASGNRFEASRRAAQLKQRFPDDDEVDQLQQVIRRDSAPTYEISSYHIDDTDNNEVDRQGVDVRFPFPRRVDLEIGYNRYELTNTVRDTDGTVDSAWVSLLLRPTSRQRLTIRGGVDQLGKTGGGTDTEATGNLIYTVGVGGKVESTLQAERRTLRYTTTSLDRGITIDSYSGRVLFKPLPPLRVSVGGSWWTISDDNERTEYNAGISWRWPVRSWRIDSAYEYRFFDYDQNLDNGYFDPQDFTSQSIGLTIQRDLGSYVYVNGGVDTGLQSFTLGAAEVTDDRYMTSTLLIGFHLTSGLALEIRGTTGDYALQNAAGYESDEWTARLRWMTGW